MKQAKVVVRWREGLHLRSAAGLEHLGKRFNSRIITKCGGKVADARSILSLLSLCATLETVLDVEATGDDENDAARAVDQVFSANDTSGAPSPKTERNLKAKKLSGAASHRR